MSKQNRLKVKKRNISRATIVLTTLNMSGASLFSDTLYNEIDYLIVDEAC